MIKTLSILSAASCLFWQAQASTAELPKGYELGPGGVCTVDKDNAPDNGSFSVTFTLDAATLRQALSGTRTQVVEAHLNAGRKPKTDVGYAIVGGTVCYTYIQYFADQITPMVVEGDALQAFVQQEGNIESITGGVITLVHASHQNTDGVEPGSYFYLDIYTPDGVVSFTGYAERLKISDRKFNNASVPEGSPAVRGMLFPDSALSAEQAAAANAKFAPAKP